MAEQRSVVTGDAAEAGTQASTTGLVRWLALLADEDRRMLVNHLAQGAVDGRATIGELAFAAGLSRFSASRHLQAMRDAGLVDMLREGNRVLVSLIREPFQQIDDWVWEITRTFDLRGVERV